MKANDIIRYNKTGKTFKVLGFGRIVGTMEPVTIYKDEDEFKIWVHPDSNMFNCGTNLSEEFSLIKE